MSDQDWFLDRIQFPNALHLTIADQHTEHADNFLSALRQAVTKAKEKKIGSASSRFLVSFVKGLSRLPAGKIVQEAFAYCFRIIGKGG